MPYGNNVPPELLIIARQPSTANRKRADLFAIDQDGTLIVIEVKRDAEDERGRVEGMEFQAIRYAASSRRMSAADVIDQFANYIRKTEGEADDELDGHRLTAIKRLASHLEDETETFTEEDLVEIIDPSVRQKIYLVAADFDPEVTAACAWLREHEIEIACFRLQPFKIGDTTCLNRERLIPPPELDDFYLDMATPAAGGRASRARRQSDKPKLLTWSNDFPDIAVTSWKDALIQGVKKLLESGLTVNKLPMRNAASSDDSEIVERSPAKLSETVSIECRGSADQIRSWLSLAIQELELKDDNEQPIQLSLQIETRAGEIHTLPAD